MEIIENYQAAADLLKDRVVLVTGAGDGIGAAAARAFAAHGATVILLGRTVRKLEDVYDAIEQAGGPQPAIYPMNLEGATFSDCQNMATTIETEFGRLDGLLHNAAMLGTLTPVEQYDMDLWTRVLQINLTAPFMLTRACLPLMRESQDASIIFTSAAVGREPRAYWGAYAVSNAGIESLSAVLADEVEAYAPIRVNSIDPGPVRTRLRALAYPGEDPEQLKTPDEILGTYLYLMGPDSRGTSGKQFCAQQR